MTKLICIDIGGTAVKHGVIEEDLHFPETGAFPTPSGGAAIVDAVAEQVRRYQKKYPEAKAVCISSTAIIDSDRGIVAEQNEELMPGYTGLRIAERITAAAQLPCHVENDVNCAALAEYYAGAAKGSSSCLMLTVGTGIGGAFLKDGRLLKGHTYSACEIGYIHMEGGTFEQLGATSVLSRKVAKDLGRTAEETDGKWIFDQAKAGNPVCVRRIDEMCGVLAKGISNLCYVLNPELVVIGGGISAQEEYLRPRIEQGMSRYLIPFIARKTRLSFAALKNNAGMTGACFAAGYLR